MLSGVARSAIMRAVKWATYLTPISGYTQTRRLQNILVKYLGGVKAATGIRLKKVGGF